MSVDRSLVSHFNLRNDKLEWSVYICLHIYIGILKYSCFISFSSCLETRIFYLYENAVKWLFVDGTE